MGTPLLFCGLGAYILGAIPFALIVSQLNGVNLREQGSGNLGSTNVFRVMGWKWGLLVFTLDLLKGFFPVYMAISLFDAPAVHVGMGVIAVLGHSYTIFAGFRGGKGLRLAWAYS